MTMDGMEVTERFHVYTEPSEEHNEREEELIANENKANPNRWIDPHGHEAWAGSGPEAMGLREAYEVLFGPAIERYNRKQKRKDRRKTVEGYMQEVREDGRGRKNKAVADANERAMARGRPQDVRKDQGKHESYEVVLSLGNVDHRMPEDVAERIYRRYVEEWPERNPNFYLYRADYHDGEWFRVKDDDEAGQDITGIGGPPGKWRKGVPHPHLSFVPFADGCFKQGMDRQNSVGQALRAMKCGSWQEWEERERAYIADLAAEYGYTVVRAPEDGRHGTALSAEEYQEIADGLSELADGWAELAAAAAAMESERAGLEEREAGLEERKAGLDERQADLDQRSGVIQLMEQSIQGVKNVVEEELKEKRERQEAELKAKADELAERERELKEKAEALEAKEKEQNQRAVEQDERDTRLGRREAVVASGEANLKKEVAAFKERRERVKARLNDAYVQHMAEVGKLARRMRRLASDRSVAAELERIEKAGLNPEPMFSGKDDGLEV